MYNKEKRIEKKDQIKCEFSACILYWLDTVKIAMWIISVQTENLRPPAHLLHSIHHV